MMLGLEVVALLWFFIASNRMARSKK
jgi:hypothetical protein